VNIYQGQLPLGLSWGSSGLLFGQQNGGVLRLSPTGGKPETIAPQKDEIIWAPRLLPDSENVLFTALAAGQTGATGWNHAQIAAQSIRTGERKILIEGGADARYLSTGHLVCAAGGSLFAVRLNLERLEVALCSTAFFAPA
jgi:hypothetical protein